MSYDTKEIIEKTLEVISKNDLMFIEDCVAYLPFTKTTFYNHKLHEVDAIKEALTENKVKTKVKLRKDWKNSDNPTSQVALYKLIGTEKEYDRLANTKQKIDANISGNVTITPKEWIESPDTY